MVDHLIWHEEEVRAQGSQQSDDTIELIDDLPDGNAKMAANAINLMLLSSANGPENISLCYDELSAALSPRMLNNKTHKFIDRPFLGWLCDYVTNEFQSGFVIDEIPQIDGLELDRKFNLNTEEESQNVEVASIAINIAGLVFDGSSSKSMLSTLCPVFNLLRILHFHRFNGDLEGINAVLGCPVIFPKFINSPEDLELMDDAESDRNKMILDTFFHTANWFREVICAFTSQQVLNIRKKVLIRLSELIALEEHIRNLIRVMPVDYQAPKSQFMTLTGTETPLEPFKKPKLPGKPSTRKTNQDTNVTQLGVTTQSNTLGNLTTKSKSVAGVNFYGPKEVYRQLDIDIMLLLQESLCTEFPLPKEKIGSCLGLLEYQFIVEDLILKLESVTGIRKFNQLQKEREQFVLSPVALICDTKQFLPRFEHFFNQLQEAIHRLRERMSGSDDCNDEINRLKYCLGITLRLFAAFLSWPGFHQAKNEQLLKSK